MEAGEGVGRHRKAIGPVGERDIWVEPLSHIFPFFLPRWRKRCQISSKTVAKSRKSFSL
jgi:hypothetical protein